MANNNQNNNGNNNDAKQKKKIKQILNELGLGGEYMALIDAAVRHDWGVQQFITRLTNTESFRNTYPGLIDAQGNLQSFLVGAENVSISRFTLGEAIKRYGELQAAYKDVADKYGRNFNRQMMAEAIKGDVSPDEFGNRMEAIVQVSKNKEAYKILAKNLGVAPTDRALFELAATTRRPNAFVDAVEQTQLQTQLGISGRKAGILARDQVGATGELNLQTLDQLIGYVRQNLAQVGPELQRQGINAAKLVKVLANPGDYQAEVDKIRQTVTARESLYQAQAGSYAQRGVAGGLSLYDAEQTRSYG